MKYFVKKLLVFLLIAALMLSAGCRQITSQYRLALGGASGLYYTCGEKAAAMLNESQRSVRILPLETAGSEENLRLLQNGQAELALVQSDFAAKAEAEQPGMLFGVASLYKEHLQIVATQRSGITSVTEMRAKRVSIGADGSGTQKMALAVLEACGVELRDVQIRALSLEESARALREGQLDAYFILSGIPNDATAELAKEEELRFVPLKEEILAALAAKEPLWKIDSIPANAYGMENEKLLTLSVSALLVSTSALTDADAQTVAAALIEGRKELPVLWQKQDPVTQESFFEEMTVPAHPGALAVFAEKEEE